MITILMPIYNGIEFINDSVQSIISQTYEDWELIIGINGLEKDSSVFKVAQLFQHLSPKIRVYDFYTLSGKSETLNEMVKYAKYNHIALLDVDDIWDIQKLETQLPFINEGYDVVGSRCIYFGENTRFNGQVPSIAIGDISTHDFFEFNPIINSSAVIKKEHCLWDGSLQLEDYNLWLSLRMKNKKFYNCEQILVKHRIHPESAFNSKGNENRVPELLAKYKL